jgi:hypothetical protein
MEDEAGKRINCSAADYIAALPANSNLGRLCASGQDLRTDARQRQPGCHTCDVLNARLWERVATALRELRRQKAGSEPVNWLFLETAPTSAEAVADWSGRLSREMNNTMGRKQYRTPSMRR